MTLKKFWIPTLIFTLIGGTVKICDTIFNAYGDGFIFDSTVCNWIFSICALLLLITGWILSIIDSRKVFEIQPQRNIFCGLFGFISSVAIIGGGVMTLLSENPNVAQCIFAVIGGGLLLYESCISFTGHNGLLRMPVLTLLVPVWCCTRFFSIFIEYTHRSVAATEIFDIVAVAALLMFLFYQSMFFAGINNTSAVRRSTVYAMVFVMLGVTVSVDMFIKMFMPSNAVTGIDSEIVLPTLSNILIYAGDLALCAYALFFTMPNIKAADKVALILEETEEEPEETKAEAKTEKAETEKKSEETKAEEKTEEAKTDEKAETEEKKSEE